jgi:hypothetical protein
VMTCKDAGQAAQQQQRGDAETCSSGN